MGIPRSQSDNLDELVKHASWGTLRGYRTVWLMAALRQIRCCLASNTLAIIIMSRRHRHIRRMLWYDRRCVSLKLKPRPYIDTAALKAQMMCDTHEGMYM